MQQQFLFVLVIVSVSESRMQSQTRHDRRHDRHTGGWVGGQVHRHIQYASLTQISRQESVNDIIKISKIKITAGRSECEAVVRPDKAEAVFLGSGQNRGKAAASQQSSVCLLSLLAYGFGAAHLQDMRHGLRQGANQKVERDVAYM